jgi:hypothetical protein
MKVLWFFFWCVLLLLSLAACEGFQLPGSTGSSTPTGGSSTNTSPGTQTSGPIIITTDHSVYHPSEQVHVTVRNTLSTAIYAFDTKASCSILDLQMQVKGAWQVAPVARCSVSRPPRQVVIQPGETYTTTIQANTPGLDSLTFPGGIYRLLLSYSTTPGKTSSSSKTTIPSATFTVSGTGGTGSSQAPVAGTPATKDLPPSTPTP